MKMFKLSLITVLFLTLFSFTACSTKTCPYKEMKAKCDAGCAKSCTKAAEMKSSRGRKCSKCTNCTGADCTCNGDAGCTSCSGS